MSVKEKVEKSQVKKAETRATQKPKQRKHKKGHGSVWTISGGAFETNRRRH
jgi:hypothetical protein